MKRQLVKQEAKNCLKGNWKNAIIILAILAAVPQIISLIGSIIVLAKGYFNELLSYTNDISGIIDIEGNYIGPDLSELLTPAFYKGVTALSVVLILSLIASFVVTIFSLSKVEFFFKIADGEKPTIKDFFKTKRYFESLKIELFVAVKLLLWGLIGIIPLSIAFIFIFVNPIVALLFFGLGYIGLIASSFLVVVKALQYAMAQYLKYKNPDKTCSECVKESTRIMNGYKAQFFTLLISFIGWYILIALGAEVISMFSTIGGVPMICIVSIVSGVYSVITSAAIEAYVATSSVIFYKEITNPYLDQKFNYATASGATATAPVSGSEDIFGLNDNGSDKSTLQKTEGINANDETEEKDQVAETEAPTKNNNDEII